MLLRDIFKQDINREISGVVKVGDADPTTVAFELNEYVVTREIERHLIKFFNAFENDARLASTDIGVWISGFFGSGKSHFLKMLSYLLENQEVQGKPVVEYFYDKTIKDQLRDAIEESLRVNVETILFNIDSKSPMEKDSSAILKVFSRVFYEHLGYYGSDLKTVRLEQYLASKGKLDDFKNKIKELYDQDWEKFRTMLAIRENKFYDALAEVIDVTREEAQVWMHDTHATISVNEFVKDIKDYVDSKPDNYRLVFLVDEIGQYIGTSSDLMLNLQTLVEDIGVACRGKVWIVVTSQESIDNITKNNMNDFSKISARFKTRLPLSSTSVDEVIKKRVLEKVDLAQSQLTGIYTRSETILRNLYTFDRKASTSNIVAYRDVDEFVAAYPFAQYQFKLMQDAFLEIRKSGAAGQHMAGGERSMLSGFFEIAKSMQNENIGVLVPLYRFYDTFDTFLQGSIRRVIDKALVAAERNEGLIKEDVDVLKLLFIMRHVNDVKATLDNLVVLMIDHLDADRIKITEQLQQSLQRLMKENYVTQHDDIYLFLTDEEQLINREISEILIDNAKITEAVHNRIFNDIYPLMKYKYQRYDFEVKRVIDNTTFGQSSASLEVNVLTHLSDLFDAGDERLIMDSGIANKKAIIVLNSAYKYIDEITKSEQIRNYVRSKAVAQLPDEIQRVIKSKQQQATTHDNNAKELIRKALAESTIYVAGEKLNLQSTNETEKLNHVLKLLVREVYGKLDYVDHHFENDIEINRTLRMDQSEFEGIENNKAAINEVRKYLDVQKLKFSNPSVGDIQRNFQAVPFGFREIDIAGVIATMFAKRMVTLTHNERMKSTQDADVVDLLRKRNLIDQVKINILEPPAEALVRHVINFMQEYYGVMPVANNVEDIQTYLISDFQETLIEVKKIKERYIAANYPGRDVIQDGIRLFEDCLRNRNDTIAFFNMIVDYSSNLLDWHEDFKDVQFFFKNQVKIYDEALLKKVRYENDRDFFVEVDDFEKYLNSIKETTEKEKPYRKINELQDNLEQLNQIYNQLLEVKIKEAQEKIEGFKNELIVFADNYQNMEIIVDPFVMFVESKIIENHGVKNIADVLASVSIVEAKKHQAIQRIVETDEQRKQAEISPNGDGKAVEKNLHKVATIRKESLVKSVTISNDEELEQVLEEIREKLKARLKDFDSVVIS